jgi:hypothetical protein
VTTFSTASAGPVRRVSDDEFEIDTGSLFTDAVRVGAKKAA